MVDDDILRRAAEIAEAKATEIATLIATEVATAKAAVVATEVAAQAVKVAGEVAAEAVRVAAAVAEATSTDVAAHEVQRRFNQERRLWMAAFVFLAALAGFGVWSVSGVANDNHQETKRALYAECQVAASNRNLIRSLVVESAKPTPVPEGTSPELTTLIVAVNQLRADTRERLLVLAKPIKCPPA